jgi:hypothetical protein
MNKMAVKLLPTALLYWLYSGISTLVFILTTGGWFIIIEIYLAPILPSFGFILLIARLFRVQVLVPQNILRRIIIFLLGFQALAIITNYGDCGDAAGGYNFIQAFFIETISGQRSVCYPQTVEPIIPLGAVISIRLIYYFLNLVFIGILILSPYRSSH